LYIRVKLKSKAIKTNYIKELSFTSGEAILKVDFKILLYKEEEK
jgi:hypothetical protein